MKYIILFLAATFYAVQVSNGGNMKGKHRDHNHGNGHGHGHGHNGENAHHGHHGNHDEGSHKNDRDKNHKHGAGPHGPHHSSHKKDEGATGGHHCSGDGTEEPIYEKMEGGKPPGGPDSPYDTLPPHDPAYELLTWPSPDDSHYDKLPKPRGLGEPKPEDPLYETLKLPDHPYENLNYPCHCPCGHRVGSHEGVYDEVRKPLGELDSDEKPTRPPLPIRPHNLGSHSVEQCPTKNGGWKGKSFFKKRTKK